MNGFGRHGQVFLLDQVFFVFFFSTGQKKIYRQPNPNIKLLSLVARKLSCFLLYVFVFSKIFTGHIQPIEMLCLAPIVIFQHKKVDVHVSFFKILRGFWPSTAPLG